MKILLSGQHGYIGAVTGPLLHAAGHEVTGLDTFYREVRLTFDRFEGDRYIRLKRLRLLLERGELDPDLRWQRDRERSLRT